MPGSKSSSGMHALEQDEREYTIGVRRKKPQEDDVGKSQDRETQGI